MSYEKRLQIMKGLIAERASIRGTRRGQDPARCNVRIEGRTRRHPGVYYVQGELTGLIKIGLSNNVQKRLNNIQGSPPDRIRVLAIDWRNADRGHVEAELHQRFRASRAHGEWFEPTPELLAHIAAVRSVMEMADGPEVVG